MNIAILYSGGKDSTYAIHHAIEKGWKIKYLISVKPTRKDCYLFHYATVEQTKELSKNFNCKHFLLKCSIANSNKEAEIVKKLVANNQKSNKLKIDALVLGGTGLQETQLKSLQKALMPLRIEVFAAHAGLDHDRVIEEMIARGYKIMITQVASDGLMKWLGRVLTAESFKELQKDSLKYGFHIGFEGGYADTLVIDAPIFKKSLKILEYEKIIEDHYCGHIIIKKAKLVNKTALSNSKRIILD